MFPVLVPILLASACLRTAEARVNATGAVAVFLITDCAACTSDKNSIFCSQAGSDNNFVNNGTVDVTIAMKKNDPKWNPAYPAVNTPLGPADGAKYCWAGTFGSLLDNSGNYSNLLGSANVLVSLDCAQSNLFYRQCIIPMDMAIILMSVGSVAFVLGITLLCFCCGCCKCCNEKGDESKWGCCNRFCPWCTLCADKHLREKEVNLELSDERSLTGKSSKLNDAYGKSLGEKEKDRGDKGDGGLTMKNPMMV